MLDSHSAGEGLGWQDSKLTNRRLSKSVGARTGLVKMRRIGTGLPAGDRWLGDRSADLVFDCDVLIVGGGGAGLRAALAAVESRPEARVIIATKGELDPLRFCTTCTRCLRSCAMAAKLAARCVTRTSICRSIGRESRARLIELASQKLTLSLGQPGRG